MNDLIEDLARLEAQTRELRGLPLNERVYLFSKLMAAVLRKHGRLPPEMDARLRRQEN